MKTKAKEWSLFQEDYVKTWTGPRVGIGVQVIEKEHYDKVKEVATTAIELLRHLYTHTDIKNKEIQKALDKAGDILNG